MIHKLIELCQSASVPIKLALLAWSAYMLQSDAPVVTGISFNWKAAYALIAITSATVLAADLFQWIQGLRPSRRFRVLQPSISTCLMAVEANVDLDLPADKEQDIDKTYIELIDRHRLFNKLASLGITLPDTSKATDVVIFLLDMALYANDGNIRKARQFSKDLRGGRISYE